jgi:DNA processing protein
MDNSLPYQIALTLIPKLGPVKAKRLIAKFNPHEVFKASPKELREIEGITPEIVQHIQQFNKWKLVEEELHFIERNQISTHFSGEKSYPHRLLHCPDAPILLYTKGNANLNAERMIAIVGTRRNSIAGKLATEKLIESLVPYQCSIVSGLAYGIDTIAHQAALQMNLPTLGVLAHGLDRIYPSSNRALAKKIIQQEGALVTENRKGIQAEEFLFPKRNRIVAALTDATIVIESDSKGGSLLTAQLAYDYHRPVFALPGRIADKTSRGCLSLIKNNVAIMLTSVEDIVIELNWVDKSESLQWQQEKHSPEREELTPEEKLVWELIKKNETATIEFLLKETHWSHPKLASALLNIELAGLIVSLPGNSFSIA